MNDLLRPYLRKLVLVVVYDILIYNNSYSHLAHLNLLVSNKFFAKLPKYVFVVDNVQYLGQVISKLGIAPNSKKV